MKILKTCLFALWLAVPCAGPVFAADDGPRNATALTVIVEARNRSAVLEKLNKMHTEMAAKGFKFTHLELIEKSGDVEVAFVTYIRD